MRNVKLVLQYDGTNYAGWQVQDNAETIQNLVEKALATILRDEIRIAGASRTDAGVHALEQVAAFKSENTFPLDKLHRSLNGILPADIRVVEVAEIGEGFTARYAKEKTYRYALACGEFVSPFQKRYAWHLREKLDFDAMCEAAGFFVGEHDFTSFTAAGGGEKSHVREILSLEFGQGGIVNACVDELDDEACDSIIEPGGQGVYHFDISATGFLYKMVRNIIGTLVEVGRGKIAPDEIPDIIEAKDRQRAGPTAPARGLCLVSIRY